MHIVLSGGGTAGHVYPALAVADILLARGHSVTFVGTPKSFEAQLVAEKGVPFLALRASGFNRTKPLSLITSSAKIASSTRKAFSWLGKNRPAAVVGFGGYVSLPVGVAARMRHIPIVIHEQNSVAGMANRYLSRYAAAAGVTYPESAAGLTPSVRIVHTGNPVREEILAADGSHVRSSMGIDEDAVVLLVFGGSRGARHINDAVVALAPEILSRDNVQVIHITGAAEEPRVKEALCAHGVDTPDATSRWHLFGYRGDIGDLFAAADVIIGRAGATSLAELTALGRAMILVPYPHATENHQEKNARACVECGAAIHVADADLDSEAFKVALTQLLDNAEMRDTMSEKARELGKPHAADALADLILEVAGSPSQDGDTTLTENGH